MPGVGHGYHLNGPAQKGSGEEEVFRGVRCYHLTPLAVSLSPGPLMPGRAGILRSGEVIPACTGVTQLR